MERERQIAAKRHSAQHDARHVENAAQQQHVLDALLYPILRRLRRAVTARMAAHVPGEDLAVAGERADVAVPHPPASAEAVAEQQGWTAGGLAVHVIVDAGTA